MQSWDGGKRAADEVPCPSAMIRMTQHLMDLQSRINHRGFSIVSSQRVLHSNEGLSYSAWPQIPYSFRHFRHRSFLRRKFAFDRNHLTSANFPSSSSFPTDHHSKHTRKPLIRMPLFRPPAILRRCNNVSQFPRPFSTSPAANNFAQVTLIGRLAAEPELTATSTGRDLVKYAIATNYGPRDDRQTSWWKIVSFDERSRDTLLAVPKG